NFAAHPTMLPWQERKFSADYPGAMAALVEKETGAPCLFLQGAAGDMSANALGANGPEAFGRVLGKEVLELAKGIHCADPDKPSLQVREDDFRFANRIDLGNPVVRAAYSKAFFPELVDFFVREYKDGVRPHLTTALLDGRVGI